ncbi:hypothetical protein ACFSJY_18705 [Thalassotalea euphylliae]|uniref:hypothetical protein n=1 Tax=Thalassotalea euphylliae TaxID=1655234 RepID=UPI003625DC7C
MKYLLIIFALLGSTIYADELSEQVLKMKSELNGSCNYIPTEKLKNNKELSCVVSKIANRCNKIDDCYSYCLATDLDEKVGGGCAHICNYSNQENWWLPDEVKDCPLK